MSVFRAGFERLTWLTLGVTLWVIGWGAFVRASGSGAGCGAHWPICNGAIVPPSPSTATLIELTHRVTSGLLLLLTLALVVVAFRSFSRGHAVRRAVGVAFFFLLAEAGVGALLVRQQWVGQDASSARAGVVAIHLVNTFFLLGALALVTEWMRPPPVLAGRPGPGAGFAFPLVSAGWLAVGASGAIAALGDTLFPVTSLGEGWRQDVSANAHFLIRLRVLHPLLAIATSLAAAGVALHQGRHGTDAVRARARWILAGVAAQTVLGAVNLGLLAPVSLQLAHLLLGDILWIAWAKLGGALWRPGSAAQSVA